MNNNLKSNSKIKETEESKDSGNLNEIVKDTIDDIFNFSSNEVKETKKSKKHNKNKNLGDLEKIL